MYLNCYSLTHEIVESCPLYKPDFLEISGFQVPETLQLRVFTLDGLDQNIFKTKNPVSFRNRVFKRKATTYSPT